MNIDQGQESALVKTDHDPVTGKFAPGNKAAKSNHRALIVKYHDLQCAFWDAVGLDDMRDCKKAHLELINQAEDKDVRLRAIALFYDRVLGKAVDRVSVDVSHSGPLSADKLTDEDLTKLTDIFGKLGQDPEIVVD